MKKRKIDWKAELAPFGNIGREVSREYWVIINASGWRNLCRARVICALKALRVATQHEVLRWLEAQLGVRLNQQDYNPRYAELKQAGLVAYCRRRCTIKGRMLTGRYLTDKLPTSPIEEVKAEKAFRVRTGSKYCWFSTQVGAMAAYLKVVDTDADAELAVFTKNFVLGRAVLGPRGAPAI